MRNLKLDFTQESALIVVLAAVAAGDPLTSDVLSTSEKDACQEILEQLADD